MKKCGPDLWFHFFHWRIVYWPCIYKEGRLEALGDAEAGMDG